jgi:hypothetical protein
LTDTFAVWVFVHDAEEWHERIGPDDLDARTAVELAKKLVDITEAGGARMARIIIVDDEDNTVFEWRLGEGVTFPRVEN